MLLSRESQYGLEGLIVLARQPRGTVMLLRDIARAGRLPVGFLGRTLQKLRRHNLLCSYRGAVRGYALTRRPEHIRVSEIVEAIEGPNVFRRCVFSPHHPADPHPCRLHDEWVRSITLLHTALHETTLAEVARRAVTPRA